MIQQFDETDSDRKKESEEKNVKKEEDLVKVQEIRKKYLSKLSAKQENVRLNLKRRHAGAPVTP